jgi:hypothetical protein
MQHNLFVCRLTEFSGGVETGPLSTVMTLICSMRLSELIKLYNLLYIQ